MSLSRTSVVGLTVLAGLTASPWMSRANGQEARYELGRRVRAFEQDWNARPDPGTRKRASRWLAEAVTRFFSLRLDRAAESIAEARFALESAGELPPARRWGESLTVKPAARLVAAGRGEVPVTVDAFFTPGVSPPADARVRLVLRREGQPAAGPRPVRESALGALPVKLAMPLDGVPPGDHRVVFEVLSGAETLANGEVGLSVAPDLAARLEAAGAAVGRWPYEASAETTPRATARAILQQLRDLAAGRVIETDLPAARLLGELEEVVRSDSRGEPYYGPSRPGEFWLTLALKGGRTAPTRVLVPGPLAPGRKVPLVVAMHGAGGSENMFFDAYGAGEVVRLCQARGWILVAPRAGAPVEEVAAALGALYPIEPKRVVLVGHSMGAAMAVAAAVRTPQTFAAVAALGGGGRVRAADGLAALPFFVGYGADDFARPGAQSLVRELKALGVKPEVREYPDTEHLAVVAVALPDVFAWLDRVLAARPEAGPR